MVLTQQIRLFKLLYCYWFHLFWDSYYVLMIFPYMLKLPKLVKVFDQGSILMVVYGAFSGAVVAGLWHQVSGMTLLLLIIACSVLLTLVMWLALYVPKWLGFST